MPDQTPIAPPGEGGAYVIDPDTGLPVLQERTQPLADVPADTQPANE